MPINRWVLRVFMQMSRTQFSATNPAKTSAPGLLRLKSCPQLLGSKLHWTQQDLHRQARGAAAGRGKSVYSPNCHLSHVFASGLAAVLLRVCDVTGAAATCSCPNNNGLTAAWEEAEGSKWPAPLGNRGESQWIQKTVSALWKGLNFPFQYRNTT